MKTVTLIDGSQMPSDSSAWRDECFARWKHVQAVMAMRGKANQPARQQYIEQVDFLEGAEAGKRLREAVRRAWSEAA